MIVNWNTGGRLRSCLEAIAASRRDGLALTLWIVDNASSDGSAAVEAPPGLALQMVRNSENRGFGAACNQAAALGEAELILFLNPDTRVRPTTLRAASDFMLAHRDVAISGVRLVDGRGRLVLPAARAPSLRSYAGRITGLSRLLPGAFPPHFLSERELRETRPVDQVSGAFFMIRRQAFEGLGGFDERFFVYYEDADLALRARRRGYPSWYVASISCVHEGGGSSAAVPARRLYHNTWSRFQFAAKHLGLPSVLAMAALTCLVEAPARLARAALRGSRSELAALAEGYRLLARRAREHW